MKTVDLSLSAYKPWGLNIKSLKATVLSLALSSTLLTGCQLNTEALSNLVIFDEVIPAEQIAAKKLVLSQAYNHMIPVLNSYYAINSTTYGLINQAQAQTFDSLSHEVLLDCMIKQGLALCHTADLCQANTIFIQHEIYEDKVNKATLIKLSSPDLHLTGLFNEQGAPLSSIAVNTTLPIIAAPSRLAKTQPQAPAQAQAQAQAKAKAKSKAPVTATATAKTKAKGSAPAKAPAQATAQAKATAKAQAKAPAHAQAISKAQPSVKAQAKAQAQAQANHQAPTKEASLALQEQAVNSHLGANSVVCLDLSSSEPKIIKSPYSDPIFQANLNPSSSKQEAITAPMSSNEPQAIASSNTFTHAKSNAFSKTQGQEQAYGLGHGQSHDHGQSQNRSQVSDPSQALGQEVGKGQAVPAKDVDLKSSASLVKRIEGASHKDELVKSAGEREAQEHSASAGERMSVSASVSARASAKPEAMGSGGHGDLAHPKESLAFLGSFATQDSRDNHNLAKTSLVVGKPQQDRARRPLDRGYELDKASQVLQRALTKPQQDLTAYHPHPSVFVFRAGEY